MHCLSNVLFPKSNLLIILGLLGCVQLVAAQNSADTQRASQQSAAAEQASGIVGTVSSKSPGKKAESQRGSSALLIGPGDELEIAVYGAPDLSDHTRVSAGGNISVPLIGYVHVAGLTSSEAEGEIEAELRQGKILNDPQVSVFVKEYTNSSVSLVGEVARPGSYSTLGPHRLFDVLQAAGGLTEKAADRAVISHQDSENTDTVELSKDPAKMALSNVEIQPGDTVVVPAAPIVYVLGEVNKPGGYILGSSVGVTLLRVVAAAGGPTRDASMGRTKMLRRTPKGLQEIPVPLKKLLHARAPDIPLEADDIIYVPNSGIKEVLNAGALATSLGTVALYRIP